jgi:hypothetical protein
MNKAKIWIDLDNSPHVPFFHPIIKELNRLHYDVFLTARDCSQTCGLADLYEMKYERIGRHYGKNKALKLIGLGFRAMQLARMARKERPALALSHGSRSQQLAASLLRITTFMIYDYEYAKELPLCGPEWIMVPVLIPDGAVKGNPKHLLKYPGIKEDVYVPSFRPDPAIREGLGISSKDLLVTIRPPATEAHYHNPESEALFLTAVNRLGVMDGVRMVILPRNEAQSAYITSTWPKWCSSRKIIIPEHVVDGLNLLWHSDLAISGGGTMNREATALGVPVYSIFRGKIGAVDQYLAETGRLTLLENIEDVQTKLSIIKRVRPSAGPNANATTLNAVVEGIVRALESVASRT